MTREELTLKIQTIKRQKKLTWKQIATAIGTASPIVTTAALFGQMHLDDGEAAKAAELLGLSDDERTLLTEIPYRGSLPPGPPADPLIYRFYELVQVYGTTWKALIQEEFGDGIMSAIDFNMQMEREPNPAGDRVKITMSGKFCPTRSTSYNFGGPLAGLAITDPSVIDTRRYSSAAGCAQPAIGGIIVSLRL
jgi:cyanate lyase